MPGSAKILTLIVTVAAAIAFAACGGASGEGDAGVPPVEEELFVSNGVEVLSASADRFEQVITSTEGSMDMSVSGDGVEFGIAADFAFEAPDSMYVSMTMSGGDETNLFDPSALGEMEVLVRDGVFYTSMPFLGGWISMSLEGMGLTGDELQEALSGSAAFDYGALVDAFGGVEFAGEETIDGRDLIHYRVSAELSDALAALSGALDSVSGGVDGYVDPAISGPISMDVWVGAEDYLPYLVTLDLDISAPEEGDFSVDMTVEIDAYNADVTIPDAPEDALAFDELFGGEGGEGFGFEDFFGGEGGDSSGFDDLFGAGS